MNEITGSERIPRMNPLIEAVTPEIGWCHVYWRAGSNRRGAAFTWAVTEPPVTGWSHAIVLTGEKTSTLVCPYTLQAFRVTNGCAEISTAKAPRQPFDRDQILALLQRRWELHQTGGVAGDWDDIARVFRALDEDAPRQLLQGGEVDARQKGGKEADEVLTKPVKAASKRGRFLKWFMDGDGSRAVRDAMAEFDMTRNNVLSYLYMLRKDHGIGYVLKGDVAELDVPGDGEGLFS